MTPLLDPTDHRGRSSHPLYRHSPPHATANPFDPRDPPSTGPCRESGARVMIRVELTERGGQAGFRTAPRRTSPRVQTHDDVSTLLLVCQHLPLPRALRRG